MKPRHDTAPPMGFADNAEWLAREIAAQPATLRDKIRLHSLCTDAWMKLEAMQLNRMLQRARRAAP